MYNIYLISIIIETMDINERMKRERRKMLVILLLLGIFVWFFLYFVFTQKSDRSFSVDFPIYNLPTSIESVNTLKLNDLAKEEDFNEISSQYNINSAQKYELSCEINVTSIIHNTLLKEKTTEDEIFEQLSKKSPFMNKKSKQLSIDNWNISFVEGDPIEENWMETHIDDKQTYTKEDLKNWYYIWWDPDKWFVWDIDGSQRKMTGYWVNEKPLIAYYNNKELITEQITREKVEKSSPEKMMKYLLKQVQNWKMVQMWWDYCTLPEEEDSKLERGKATNDELIKKLWRKNVCNPKAFEKRKIHWFYESGPWIYKKINAVIWEHNFLLLWYKSDGKTITHIKVYDSYTWFHTYSLKEWLRKWTLMDYRAIIVEKKIK